MNFLLNEKWRLGLTMGLALGVILVLLFHNGWHESLGIEKPARWLASCPPLTWNWVMDFSDEVQYGILVAWWSMAGAALGWLVDGSKADKAVATLLVVVLISAHQLAYDNLGLVIERQVQEFKMEMQRLFK